MFAILLPTLSLSAPLFRAAEPVPNQYIVVFNEGIAENDRRLHLENVGRFGVNASAHYNINNFKGYATTLNKAALDLLLRDDMVQYIEEDAVVRLSDCFEQKGATWGLVRSNEKDLVITGEYSYSDNTKGVVGYVVDTGIYIQHNDFGGRASWGANFAGDGKDTDGNGHGTHVAGTMIGTKYGLAKFAELIAVKVLDAGGSGTTTGVISGIQWVADYNKAKRAGRTGVANMSLGGLKSTALNTAVTNAIANNVLFVVAAGNDNKDACNYSPASAKGALTVAASDNEDRKASFSNHGSCVDLYAPGVAITSTWINNADSDNTISGTSMACPHVAGVALKFVAEYPGVDQAGIFDLIIANTTKDKIKSNPTTTPNKIVYHACDRS
jgi:subtilisin family serine protease